MAVEIVADGAAFRWRIRSERGNPWDAAEVILTTQRPDGSRQAFTFRTVDDGLESIEEVAGPHRFAARVSRVHAKHAHDYDFSFGEALPAHAVRDDVRRLTAAAGGFQDAHELAHADGIRRRFANREVTNGQIALFGLTGGLIPCPAAITVLLLCLQLKEIPLGVVLVLSFSVGLAITLVVVGAAAALSMRHASRRFAWFSTMASRAPYLSSILIVAVGIYMGIHGWIGLSA